jgi:CRP/FNR family transcriptional regulator
MAICMLLPQASRAESSAQVHEASRDSTMHTAMQQRAAAQQIVHQHPENNAFAQGGRFSNLAELLQMMGNYSGESAGEAQLPVMTRHLSAGDVLFHEGCALLAIYFVRSGTFKTYRTDQGGYEQVLGFSGRADLLGFDAIYAEDHPNAAVALEDSSVYVLPLQDFHAYARQVSALGLMVQQAASRAMASQWDLADLMAPVAAEVRLARFLVRLSKRMAGYGQSPRRFRLRMRRRDIASYLGVAHETISRGFGVLSGNGLVAVTVREVEILDMPGLTAFSLCTRNHGDEPRRPSGPRLAAVRSAREESLAA